MNPQPQARAHTLQLGFCEAKTLDFARIIRQRAKERQLCSCIVLKVRQSEITEDECDTSADSEKKATCKFALLIFFFFSKIYLTLTFCSGFFII